MYALECMMTRISISRMHHTLVYHGMHVNQSYVSHFNLCWHGYESVTCTTLESIMAHMWMSHTARIHETWRSWMRHCTHMNATRHQYEWMKLHVYEFFRLHYKIHHMNEYTWHIDIYVYMSQRYSAMSQITHIDIYVYMSQIALEDTP